MVDIPATYIENLLAPMMAAQIFLAVLIYVLIVRKRIATSYKLHVCFLVTFIVFLAGRSLQEFSTPLDGQKILFVRMSFLFSLGFPSLWVAAALQSGLRKTRLLLIVPYVAGVIISVVYVVFMDAAMSGFVFTREMLSFCPFPITIQEGKNILFYGAFLSLVLPFGLLMIKELMNRRNGTLLAFISGALLFGILMMAGVTGTRNVSLYYVGSIASACCWAWAVFHDIRDMKGKAALLKEEFRHIVVSGNPENSREIETLLSSLEELSKGNLEMYKIRLREILSMLTDATVSAGGDTEVLIERYKEQNRAIDSSADSKQIRDIVQAEAIELSAMIAEMPIQRSNVSINKARTFIEQHFCEEINVESVAEHLQLSRAHLMREFKKSTGQTVNQYITALRMRRAKELLVDKTVTETAFEIGYNNSNYFSTVFKRNVGVSPLNYKKQRAVHRESL